MAFRGEIFPNLLEEHGLLFKLTVDLLGVDKHDSTEQQ